MKRAEDEVVEEGSERESKVIRLIEKATNSTLPEVDPVLLKAIKSVVRYSDLELRFAAQKLMDLMKRKHAQVRYLSLLIIDVLFMRSKLFRSLIVENLDLLLSLSVGFRADHPLPPPKPVANTLHLKAIEFLEKWNETYGIHYKQLRLGFGYLKNTRKIRFPNLRANAARADQERNERRMRTMEILREKFEVFKMDFSSIKVDIQATIDEVDECLEIARDGNRSSAWVDAWVEEEDGGFEEFRTAELRQLRHAALNESNKVCENGENKMVFDTLRELYRVLVKKHLACVQEWISVLIRVELGDGQLVSSMLKELIDIRNRIRTVKLSSEELGCALPWLSDNDEEDLWEEGVIEKIEVDGHVSPTKAEDGNSMVASTSASVLNKNNDQSSFQSSSHKKKLTVQHKSKASNPLRDELLAEAPVMKWGSFLDKWGARRDVLANQRGLDLDNHWGRVDYDAVIPSEKIAELDAHATLYEEDHPDIQPCRAPLRKGGFCPRRDLRVCPFHGPIIPRDENGEPIHFQDDDAQGNSEIGRDSGRIPGRQECIVKEEMEVEMDNDLVEQLAKQSVKNVRKRDKEEIKKKDNDKKLLKRAKLAAVREHNQDVLREAALASTPTSSAFAEYSDSRNLDREAIASHKNKKPTLASMLKKKVTPKDRLAQRLLSARAKDDTVRQLSKDENMKYREAFPNQW